MAQINGSTLQSGKLAMRINADGQLAIENGMPASEMTNNSNNHLFRFVNVWVSGYENGKLSIASTNGFKNLNDYSSGPLDSVTLIGANPDNWNLVWTVSRDEINAHRRSFRDQDYSVIESIKNWPANGFGQYNTYLAPFIDYDGDGKYDPAKGDYPDIRGNVSSFFILNDNYKEHKASGGLPFKIEIYGMLYVLPEAPEAVYAKYYIVNPTEKTYSDIRISLHTAFQLGNSNDNYCGTDAVNNVAFAYNGDEEDEGHFGTQKPLAFSMILDNKVESIIQISDDKDAFSGMPETAGEYRTLMEGKWKNGTSINFGDDGKGSGKTCKFIFPGSTDPSQTNNWIENGFPGERSLLMNVEFPTLNRYGYLEFNFVIGGLEKTVSDPYKEIAEISNKLKAVYLQYNLIAEPQPDVSGFWVKNPSGINENINNESFEKFQKISIIDASGRVILSQNSRQFYDIKISEKGIYFLILTTENQSITKKLIIL
ncbi:MAG: T9SS type A sorting domain-containing protein [Flavobacteriales bacterium]|nr:T9SS type A sorting domain-containing protein [Flavobacteriales bacterium]